MYINLTFNNFKINEYKIFMHLTFVLCNMIFAQTFLGYVKWQKINILFSHLILAYYSL